MPFQTSMNANMAPAVVGDFADLNPRAFVQAGPGGLIAGSQGLTVGRFAWLASSALDADGGAQVANNFGTGPVAGIVPSHLQGIIVNYLADSSLVIPGGFMAGVMSAGGIWVKNEGATQAVQGMNAFAAFANGAASFAAAGSAAAAATSSAGSIAAGTASVTGSITGNILTVTAVGSGTVVIGGLISGTGVLAGSQVLSQISGTPGGIGIYALNYGEQTVASTTISMTYGTFTAGGTITGVFGIGDVLSGTGVTAGTTITALGTGTGGSGTYIVQTTQTASSTAISAALGIQTKWIANSSALPGELVKITSHLMG